MTLPINIDDLRLRVHERAESDSASQVTGQDTGQDTGQVTEQVAALLKSMDGELRRSELQAVLGLAHRDYFNEAYLQPAIDAGLVEMTLPDKPTSRNQRYRLTATGAALRRSLAHKDRTQ